MRTKSGVIFVTCLVMVGLIATFAEAGKPFSSAPPFSPVPPTGAAVAAAGQAYVLCTTAVASELAQCVREAAGDATAIATCKADTVADVQACTASFFSAVNNATP
jgi:hypothetical protein